MVQTVALEEVVVELRPFEYPVGRDLFEMCVASKVEAWARFTRPCEKALKSLA